MGNGSHMTFEKAMLTSDLYVNCTSPLGICFGVDVKHWDLNISVVQHLLRVQEVICLISSNIIPDS